MMPASPAIEPKINPLIWTAIEQRRLLRFVYKSKERVVEPHDYGVHKGSVKLLCYQVAGASSHKLPNWRLLEEDQIFGIEVLNRTFRGGRPTPSGKHYLWEKLFIRVKAAGEA